MSSSCEAIGHAQHRDWDALREALAVFALIIVYIWWVRLYYPWVASVLLAFIVSTHFVHRENLRRLGFGWKELRNAFPRVMPWVLAMALALAAAGLMLGTLRHTDPLQAALSILAYSAWALAQQYILNGYFVNRLQEFAGRGNAHWISVAAGGMFALAHLPNWFLMVVTFAGGYACARVFLAYRSLYVLALAHGVIAFVLLAVVPESVTAHFLVGPRYVLHRYGTYPELLL